jgi:monofunctional biosynthetic peptidoglycan transglycosylase
MAKRRISRRRKEKSALRDLPRRVLRWGLVCVLALVLLAAGLMALYRVINPPSTLYMLAESRRLGGVTRIWVPLDRMAPVMARAAVAAEDANFCLHWGFDLPAIRDAIEDGATRGASTISQQTVKNVFLWHGRTYARKALEAVMTPALEAVWPKRRILEVYLNVAEFDAGIFGVEAAARHYFGVSAADLNDTQAARLAAILPDPKGRSAAQPSNFVVRRGQSILSGAATIDRDGRADCFQS